MITPEDIESQLRMLSGEEDCLPLIRDNSSDTGMRLWNNEDSGTFCEWLLAEKEEAENGASELACYNQKQVAEMLGFSVAKIKCWMDRKEDPMPHIQDGRLKRVPHFMLKEWLREESLRCAGANGDSYEVIRATSR